MINSYKYSLNSILWVKKILIVVFLFCWTNHSFCQFEFSKFMYYDLSEDLDMSLTLSKSDSIAVILNGKSLSYELTDTTLAVVYYNDIGHEVHGQYIITKHEFQKVGKTMDVDSGEMYLNVIKYKYPIKTGRWNFYDHNKKLLKTEIWSDGFQEY